MDVARSLRNPTLAKLDTNLYSASGGRDGGTRTLGVPPEGSGEDTEEQLFVLHSRQSSSRVAARNMLWNGERYIEAGPSLAIPVTYPGNT